MEDVRRHDSDSLTPKQESRHDFLTPMQKARPRTSRLTNIIELDPIQSSLRQLSVSPDRGDTGLNETKAREKLSQYTPRNGKDDTVKILTAFIDNLPPGSKDVITKFISINEDDLLHQLAYHLTSAVLVPMKAQGGKTPQVTDSPMTDMDITSDDVASEMTQSCSRNQQKPLRKDCLKRDNYRCVVTHIWDFEAKRENLDVGPAPLFGTTQCAHILPFCLGKWDTDEQLRELSKKWETIYLMFPDLTGLIRPITINIQANAMTMSTLMHEDFGKMEIALIPTDVDHEYTVKRYDSSSNVLAHLIPERVVLTQHDATVDMPSRVLIQTHATVAEILHASGQAEVIDELMRDWDNTRCLSSDGSTDIGSLLSLVYAY